MVGRDRDPEGMLPGTDSDGCEGVACDEEEGDEDVAGATAAAVTAAAAGFSTTFLTLFAAVSLSFFNPSLSVTAPSRIHKTIFINRKMKVGAILH